MTASALQALLDEAVRLSKNPSPLVRDRGKGVLRRVERFLASGRPFDIELTCAECWREGRPWFVTGVADDGLYSLCSPGCVLSWKRRHQGSRLLLRDGRDWEDRMATGKAA